MKCLSCGAPKVILHKEIWECGWCGDSGPIPRRFLEQRKAARERQEVWRQNAALTVQNAAHTFVGAVTKLLPSYPDPKTLAWKTLLCQVSVGLIESRLWMARWVDEVDEETIGRIFYPYRALVIDLLHLSGIAGVETMKKTVFSRRPLFQTEGQLTTEACGTFWELLLRQMRPYAKQEPAMWDGHLTMNGPFGVSADVEEEVKTALCSLLPLASFFAGAKEAAADARNNRFLAYLTVHWKRLRGEVIDPMDFDDSAVARMVERFPDLRDECGTDVLKRISGPELLERVYRTDPQRAIALWRAVPQTQEPLRDPARAEDLFCLLDFLWDHEDYNGDAIAPLLAAVRKEDALAEMVFRSSYVCPLHLYLIRAAMEQGKTELAEHLCALLQSNPLPRDKWGVDSSRLQALMAAHRAPVYRYCAVQVDGGRPCAYLTAGLPVKRGDTVRVPYGSKNEPRKGTVRSVADYTRDTAPWPPEKTKGVLEILQAPAKKDPAAALPQQGSCR